MCYWWQVGRSRFIGEGTRERTFWIAPARTSLYRRQCYEVGIESPKIAEDKQTAGRLVSVTVDDGTSYAKPLALAIYRKGKIIRRLAPNMFIPGWQFVDGGRKVAFYVATLHGASTPECSLYDVSSDLLPAEYRGELGPAAPA